MRTTAVGRRHLFREDPEMLMSSEDRFMSRVADSVRDARLDGLVAVDVMKRAQAETNCTRSEALSEMRRQGVCK